MFQGGAGSEWRKVKRQRQRANGERRSGSGVRFLVWEGYRYARDDGRRMTGDVGAQRVQHAVAG